MLVRAERRGKQDNLGIAELKNEQRETSEKDQITGEEVKPEDIWEEWEL
jgi:hypothetical protein